MCYFNKEQKYATRLNFRVYVLRLLECERPKQSKYKKIKGMKINK